MINEKPESSGKKFATRIFLINQLAQRDFSQLANMTNLQPDLQDCKDWDYCVDCQIDDIPLKILLDKTSFTDIFASTETETHTHDLPESIQLAIINSALTPVANAIQQNLGYKLSFLGFSKLKQDPSFDYISWKTSSESKENLFAIGYQHHSTSSLIDIIGNFPLMRAKWEDISLTYRTEIGCTYMSSEDFQSLEKGDVILIEDNFQDKGYSKLIIADSIAYPVKVDGEGFEFLSIDLPEKNQPKQDPTGTKNSCMEKYTFDYGQHEISIKNIIGLMPGCSLPHSARSPLPITIRFQGKPVACGQLVKISENAAIQIDSLEN